MDTVIPGGNIQITETGNISYGVQKRIRGQKHAPRRIVGYAWKVGQPLPISLSALRDLARAMLLDFARGIDPKAKRIADQEAAAQLSRSTFSAAAKDFLADHVAGLRSAREIGAIFQNELLPVLDKRPITDITDADIARLIKTIGKTRPALARNAHANLSKFFRWRSRNAPMG